MSRIYEALQKAESEKSAAAANSLPVREDSSRNLHRRAANVALADPELDMEPILYSDPGSVHDAPHLNLDDIASRPWSPDIKALPALSERGPGVEQFRSLRSRIYELRDIKRLQSILISSGNPQEGKSFVAANLAISLARNRNSKVLLVDGDMRRYTLHKLLGCESHPGLADYLSNRAELNQVMQRCAFPANTNETHLPGIANITLIPGGDGADRASDLSASPRFADLLNQAKSVFDWIIIDSSPVLPVSDAINLARAADGVLLVARAGVTDFTTAQKAQVRFQAAHLLGFVLNAVQKAPQLGAYYGYDSQTEQLHPGSSR